jgi:nitrate/nitrite transport system permease protein
VLKHEGAGRLRAGGLILIFGEHAMSMTAIKAEANTPRPDAPAIAASVHTLATPRPNRMEELGKLSRYAAARVIPPAVVLTLFLVVWELLCRKAGATLPPPSKVLKDTKDLILDPFFDNGGIDKGLFWHLSASLQRVALGYSLAAVAGIALGTLVGQSVWAMRGLDPIFQVLRTIPPLAWLPLSLAAFRDGQPSAIFVIFITSIWPIIINTAVGIRNIPQDYRNVAAVVQLNPLEFFWKIMIPSAAPYIFTGLRIGIGLSWLAIVAAEMLIGGVGIGFFIWDAWNSSHISEIILALFYVGIIGFVLDRMIAVLGNFATRGMQSN